MSAVENIWSRTSVAGLTSVIRSDAAITVAARFATVGLAFVTSVLVARLLGPEGQGMYAVTMTFAMTVVQLSILGMHSSNTYLLARDRSQFASLLGNSVWLSLAVGGVAAVLGLAIIHLLGWLGAIGLWCWLLAAATVPPRLFSLLGGSLLVGLQRIRAFNRMQLLLYLSLLIGIAAVGCFWADVAGVLAATALAWWFAGSILMRNLSRRMTGDRIRFDVAALKRGWRYAAKAHLACLFGFLLLRVHIFLLEHLTDSATVGYFSIANQAWEMAAIIPTSIALVLFPRLAADRQGSWQRMRGSLAAVLVYVIGLVVATLLLSRPAIVLVFGADYAPSAEIVLYLLPGMALYGVSVIFSQYLAAQGMPKSLVVSWAIALTISIVLGLLLIPRFQGTGSAIAVSATYLCQFALVWMISLMTKRSHSPPMVRG